MSSVLDVFRSGSFHTSRRISSRVTTWPAAQQQHPQQLELLVGQADLGAVDEHAAPGQLHAHAADLDRLRGQPAQQRADPGQQLGEPERLADVVVGARVEADDEVHLVGAGGEHEDGEVGHLERGCRRQTSRPSMPGRPRSSTSRSDAARADVLQRARPSSATDDLVALALQRPRQRLGDGGVVLGEQDRCHVRSLCPGRPVLPGVDGAAGCRHGPVDSTISRSRCGSPTPPTRSRSPGSGPPTCASTRKPDRSPVTDADTAAEDGAARADRRRAAGRRGARRGGRRRRAGERRAAGCSTRSTARRTSRAACPCGRR